MIQKSTTIRGVLFSCLLFGAVTGWSQIPIEGVVHESVGGARSIRVPTSSGYTYLALLDGQRIPVDVTNVVSAADYHELLVYRTNSATSQVQTQFVQFIVRAPDRGTTEDGLPPWVPAPLIASSAAELSGAHLEVLAPETIPTGLGIPVVVWIKDASGNVVRGNGTLEAAGHPGIPVKRGVGSGLLASTHPAGPLNYSAELGPLQVNRTIDVEGGTVWTNVTGTLSGNVVWGPDARISLTGSITVPSASTLTIMDGAIVRLSSQVDIVSAGRTRILGTTSRPVVFTPANAAQPWGGFYVTNTTSQLDALGTIFVSPEARQSGFPGHRDEQPFVFVDNRARVALTNCAIIFGVGQFHHSRDRGAPYATVTIVDTLIQRGTTVGEFNGCSVKFIRSAAIEFPYEDQFYCANPDCDHDGFYLNTGVHELRDSLIGWLKDDGIDSGSGGGPSIITVSNCWFEGTYHEACAWSNARRTITNTHLVTINSGQGIEAGWSGGTPPSPDIYVTDSLSLANASGIRYGDNYDWDYWGFLRVSGSIILNNHRDIHGHEWDSWNYRSDAMNIQNNYLTAADPSHPNNTVWNPASDGWRLASFMSTPPHAAVGVGFATWPNQTNMSFIFGGIPVGVSSFTTNPVTVSYTFESGATTLASGTLTFEPGETVKRIYPAGFDASAHNSLRVTLNNPVNAEMTGLSQALFSGVVPSPVLACRVGGSQVDVGRMKEGIPVSLSAPSARTITVDFEFESPSGTVASGTLTFQAGQILAWIDAPDIDPDELGFVRLKLENANGAQLGTLSTIYFAPTPDAPPPVTLVARGARWKYLANAVDQGTAWRNPAFNDSAWLAGPAELGFGDNDEATDIPDNNQITSYFRLENGFTIADPNAFSDLTLWLLADDGGVVYLNGTEVFRNSNLPPPPTVITYSQTAADRGDNQSDTVGIPASSLRANTNVVAVEIHQQSSTSSDVSFNLELIGNRAGPQRLFVGAFDGELNIVWGDPNFVLEYATDLEGTWTAVGSGSPYLTDPSGPQRFYRLRK